MRVRGPRTIRQPTASRELGLPDRRGRDDEASWGQGVRASFFQILQLVDCETGLRHFVAVEASEPVQTSKVRSPCKTLSQQEFILDTPEGTELRSSDPIPSLTLQLNNPVPSVKADNGAISS